MTAGKAMTKDVEKPASMCSDCRKLVHAGRYDKPHAQLVAVESRQFSSMLGPADETDYRCTTCGHEWLHETGSQGFGWIA